MNGDPVHGDRIRVNDGAEQQSGRQGSRDKTRVDRHGEGKI